MFTEFAFYVNKTGRRSRSNFLVTWEGTPTGFGKASVYDAKRCTYRHLALHEPFVLAFEPSFVEIRHIDTGEMAQVIQGSNLRLLFADNPPSVTNNGGGYHNPYHQQHSGYVVPEFIIRYTKSLQISWVWTSPGASAADISSECRAQSV